MHECSKKPEHVPSPVKAWKKDAEAFVRREGPCYWVGGVSYTRADFVQVANGEGAIAEHLFSLIRGQAPQTALYTLVNKGALRVPDYSSDSERTVLHFPRPPLPTPAHQCLLQQQGWQSLFPELAHPRLWIQLAPAVPVPWGIAFTDLLKRADPETNDPSYIPCFEEGNV